MKAIAAVVLVILCADAVNGAGCVCENKDLCKPITSGPRKELYVFQISGDDWKHYDWSIVTTMAVFGTFDPQMICTAHAAKARVVLAARPFDIKQLRNLTATSLWIQQVTMDMLGASVDGINIDIEDPIDASLADDLTELVENLTGFIRAKAPYAQVTYDVAWSPNCIDGRCYDYSALGGVMDFLVVMDYDMRSQIRGPCVASANSPPQLGMEGMANFTKLGILPSKLVMGLPWYGYDYPCIALSNNNTTCAIKPVPFRGVNCSDAAGTEKNFSVLKDILAKYSTTGPQFDNILQSPWFNYEDPTSKNIHQVWYDNPSSLTIKTSWAKNAGLRGVGMWTGDFVDYKTNNQDTKDMWDAMRNFF